MYAPMPVADPSQAQAKMIVNMVVVVFLVLGLMIVMQYFQFIYLRDVPLVGNWLMDIYEQVFGVPKVLILHGEDSMGDWTELRDKLSNNLLFYSEDLDVTKYGAGMGSRLGQYGLVIVEDVKRLDKDKLLNLINYVKGGGNIIWVADAGTVGVVEYDDYTLTNQTGWTREVVCITEDSKIACDCKTVKANSTCKYLPSEAEQSRLDFTAVLGATFISNEVGPNPQLEIVDRNHWSVAGIKPLFDLNISQVTKVSNQYSTALVANVNIGDEAYPSIIVNDAPGSWGKSVYFAYPPEETMEILIPLVERMRY
jgi:hypothetical protein